jgi:cysteinyl-tRNA synthetase
MNINQENISEKEGNTNILETNINNINADLTESSTGRYLYGDYSEFEENRNFINILNDYLSISNNIFVIHDKIIKLDQHIEETYNFQKDLHNRFTDFTKAMESSIYNFYSTSFENLTNIK